MDVGVDIRLQINYIFQAIEKRKFSCEITRFRTHADCIPMTVSSSTTIEGKSEFYGRWKLAAKPRKVKSL